MTFFHRSKQHRLDREGFLKPGRSDGFTLLEVIISLAVLTLLAALAFGLMQTSRVAMMRGTQKLETGYHLQDAIEHFKANMRLGRLPENWQPAANSVTCPKFVEATEGERCWTYPFPGRGIALYRVRPQAQIHPDYYRVRVWVFAGNDFADVSAAEDGFEFFAFKGGF